MKLCPNNMSDCPRQALSLHYVYVIWRWLHLLLCFAAVALLLAFPCSAVATASAAPSCAALLCSCLAVRRLQAGSRNFTCGFLSVNFIASCWPRFCNQAKFPDNCTKRCCCAVSAAASASDSAATCCGFAAKAAQKYLPQKFVQLFRPSNCPFVQASPQQLHPSRGRRKNEKKIEMEMEKTETGLGF